MSMPIVVQPIIGYACLRGNGSPELFYIWKRLSRCVAGEQVCLYRIGAFTHFGKQRQCWTRERQMLSPLLLRMMRGLDPDSTVKIDVQPTGLQYLANPRPGQNLEAHGICGALIGMDL